MKVGAVLVAAGLGTRLGADEPKAFVDLVGRSLLARAVAALGAVESIETAVVVVPEGHVERARRLARSALRDGMACVFAVGGRERQESVRNGLDALPRGYELVVVHDAARPLVRPALVARCIEVAAARGAAIAALPSVETVKEVGDDGGVLRTLDRRRVWMVQTPQVFRADVLRAAHERAAAEGIVATDDAALLERYGSRVWAVEGDRRNIKITTPEDLAWATWLLREEDGSRKHERRKSRKGPS